MGNPHPEVLHVESASSTQDLARDMPIGTIVLADHQTAGRGRMGRRWDAPPGTALLASFVLAPGPVLSLAAGVAAAEACGPHVRLKWPNDLLLDDRKLGGILVEVSGGRAVCGIGINLSWAPPGGAMLRRSRDEVFAGLHERLLHWTSRPVDEVLERWRELSATLGRRVRVDAGDHSHEGIAEDLGPGGELVVGGASFSSGSVTHL